MNRYGITRIAVIGTGSIVWAAQQQERLKLQPRVAPCLTHLCGNGRRYPRCRPKSGAIAPLTYVTLAKCFVSLIATSLNSSAPPKKSLAGRWRPRCYRLATKKRRSTLLNLPRPLMVGAFSVHGPHAFLGSKESHVRSTRRRCRISPKPPSIWQG